MSAHVDDGIRIDSDVGIRQRITSVLKLEALQTLYKLVAIAR